MAIFNATITLQIEVDTSSINEERGTDQWLDEAYELACAKQSVLTKQIEQNIDVLEIYTDDYLEMEGD